MFEADKDKIVCSFCKSSDVIKHGKDCGHQRYRCKKCGKTFSETKFKVCEGSPKSIDVWKRYFDSMMGGDSLRESANKCGISLFTSFFWRHKLLTAFGKVLENNVLKGELSFDTVFMKASYKGNRKNTPKPKLYIGISSAVASNGISRSRIASVNSMTSAAADYALSNSIEGNSDGFTDKKVFGQLASHKKIKLAPFKSREYRLKSVVSYNSRMNGFFARFNGVSSKYLENYLYWLDIPLDNKNLFDEVMAAVSNIKNDDIYNLPPIPHIPSEVRAKNKTN